MMKKQKIRIRNSPPELHKGMSYEQCLLLLIERLEEYEGESIPPDSDENEHPLHYAVRLVESWQPARFPFSFWLRLPSDASHFWGDILRNSRFGLMEFKHRSGNIRVKDYGEADSEKALKAAERLKQWAIEECKKWEE